MEKPLAMTENDCLKVKAALEKNPYRFVHGVHPAFLLHWDPKAKDQLRPKIVFGQIMEPTWDYNLWAQDPPEGPAETLFHRAAIFSTGMLVCWGRSGGTLRLRRKTHP